MTGIFSKAYGGIDLAVDGTNVYLGYNEDPYKAETTKIVASPLGMPATWAPQEVTSSYRQGFLAVSAGSVVYRKGPGEGAATLYRRASNLQTPEESLNTMATANTTIPPRDPNGDDDEDEEEDEDDDDDKTKEPPVVREPDQDEAAD